MGSLFFPAIFYQEAPSGNVVVSLGASVKYPWLEPELGLQPLSGYSATLQAYHGTLFDSRHAKRSLFLLENKLNDYFGIILSRLVAALVVFRCHHPTDLSICYRVKVFYQK